MSPPLPPTTGCVECPLWAFHHPDGKRPTIQTPNMQPTGSSNIPVALYVLGDAPGVYEDSEGVQFRGASGRQLRQNIPVQWQRVIRWNNVVRCIPPLRKGNYTPLPAEIEACKQSVLADIEHYKPKVIVAVGTVALGFLAGKSNLHAWRGVFFPFKVGSHVCWIYPIIHPSYVLQNRRNMLVAETFKQDLRRLFQTYASLPEPKVEPEANTRNGCTLLLGSNGDLDRLRAFLRQKGPKAIDYETAQLRPYSKKGAWRNILSIAITDQNDQTVAVPINHPQSPWSQEQFVELHCLLKDWFRTGDCPIIAHNLGFELEWSAAAFGVNVLCRKDWDDTMAMGFLLDSGQGRQSLDYRTRREFGLPLKELSGVDRSRLKTVDLEKVLWYNAADAKYTMKLNKLYKPRIKDYGLLGAYEGQISRVRAVVLMQLFGLPIDQEAVSDFTAQCVEKKHRLLKSMREIDLVQELEKKRNAPFNPNSLPQCREIFKKLGINPESLDKLTLQEMNHGLAKLLVEWRETTKLVGSWLEPYGPQGKYVHEDGRIHPSYGTTSVETRRTSARDPNIQAFPKRDFKLIRSIVPADPGCIFLSADAKQLEICVIGMHSQDKELCKVLRSGGDVHMQWTKRWSEIYPQALKNVGGELSKLRYDMKSDFVFASIYGSSTKGISKKTGWPLPLVQKLQGEFWATYPGVQHWQKRLLRQYAENGFVQSLSGFRRYAPLKTEQILDSPIQTDASDIVVSNMEALAELALEEDNPALCPRMNIHDDLTFMLPIDEAPELAPRIVSELLKVRFQWARTIPLAVEIEVGFDWGTMNKWCTVYRLEELTPMNWRTLNRKD